MSRLWLHRVSEVTRRVSLRSASSGVKLNMLRRMLGLKCSVILAIEICLGPTSSAALAQDTRTSIAASYQAGEQALTRGDLPGAEKAFRHVLTLTPNDAGAHANLGVV
jgi:Tfp pilus assembly protein PilF